MERIEERTLSTESYQKIISSMTTVYPRTTEYLHKNGYLSMQYLKDSKFEMDDALNDAGVNDFIKSLFTSISIVCQIEWLVDLVRYEELIHLIKLGFIGRQKATVEFSYLDEFNFDVVEIYDRLKCSSLPCSILSKRIFVLYNPETRQMLSREIV